MSDEQIPESPKKRPGRPRKAAPTAGGGLSEDQFQQLLAVLAARPADGQSAGIDLAQLREVLAATSTQTAQAMQKAMRPENETHPGISAMSYPEGDIKRPRPVLPFECWYNGYPMHQFPETQHWRELELMSLLEPGKYTVMRKDFTPMEVEVEGKYDVNQALMRVDIKFPITREERTLVPPQISLLYQLVYHDQPLRERFVAGMHEYMQVALGAAKVPMPVLTSA